MQLLYVKKLSEHRAAKKPSQYAHNVFLTFKQRNHAVMDVVWTLKQRCVRKYAYTGGSFVIDDYNHIPHSPSRMFLYTSLITAMEAKRTFFCRTFFALS